MNRKPRILVGPKLNSSDQLLMTLMHWREYRAQLRIAQTYGVSESHVSRTVRKVAPIEAQIETALTTAAVVHVYETDCE